MKNFKLPKLFKDKINLILDSNLDIIFYPDIGFSTQLFYLTFLKLAKHQITSWGHPETTGNFNIDYYLSSKLLEENFNEAQSHYQKITGDFLPMYYSKPKIQKLNDRVSNQIVSILASITFKSSDFDEIILKIFQG